MARRARVEILYDGCFAHVFSRALDEQRIFEEREDFEKFQRLLLEAKRKHGFAIHHYCLMNTHFHLAASISSPGFFSRGLQQIKSKYTIYFNKKYRHEGPLWRGRFKSLVIEDENYLYACGLYIEYNPVQAGMVKEPYDWPYSSSTHYFLGREDVLVDPYEKPAVPPEGVPMEEEFFTKGEGIGSEIFRIHLQEKHFA